MDFKASAFEKDVITTDPEYLRRKLKASKDIQREREMATTADSEKPSTTVLQESTDDDAILEIDDFDDVKTVSNYDEFDFLDDRRALSELPTPALKKPEQQEIEAEAEQEKKAYVGN